MDNLGDNMEALFDDFVQGDDNLNKSVEDQIASVYCEQHEIGYSGDCFYGKYYHEIEGSDKYFGYYYSC